jgi:magnesium chelatase family protein
VSTADARARVIEARAAAEARLASTPWTLNSQVPGAWLRGPGARLPIATTASIDRALERGGITMRGYDRVLRLGWTLADLDGATTPNADHIGRALYLRKAMTT